MYIQYTGTDKFIKVDFQWIDNNVIRIITDTEPKLDGFIAYLRENDKYYLNDFSLFTTLYRSGDGWFELSCDGSIYTEPTETPEEELSEDEEQIVSLQSEIQVLKYALLETDYQIIKAYEYYLVGKEVDYDINELHNYRQGLRDTINTLETRMYALINEQL